MFRSGGRLKAVVQDRRLLRVWMVALTLAFGILYVVQVNAASTQGFMMRDLEQANQDLRRDNDKLAAEIDRLRSLSSVSEREIFLGLVKLQQVSFIQVGNSEVALR